MDLSPLLSDTELFVSFSHTCPLALSQMYTTCLLEFARGVDLDTVVPSRAL